MKKRKSQGACLKNSTANESSLARSLSLQHIIISFTVFFCLCIIISVYLIFYKHIIMCVHICHFYTPRKQGAAMATLRGELLVLHMTCITYIITCRVHTVEHIHFILLITYTFLCATYYKSRASPCRRCAVFPHAATALAPLRCAW